MSDEERREFGEKEEKEEEKKEEKTEEKSWEEKWRRDRVGAIVWAAILIWAGLVFLVDNLNLLTLPEGLGAWSYIFAGAGVILLIEVGVRLLMPEYRRPIMGTLILGVVLLGVALGDIIDWSAIWAVVLIVIGLAMLLRGFGRRR